ncbi:putative transcriptional regulatory protein [Purpureocillium lavendulum]|uniref:Transcriptional regulatory protein n=1 Tax=Purpureocillium lavendulum TaxID=1247861 RepID=A0AB34FDI0_9HYPO|nr:putative transcriptional regulatory protein [Purpureocillium lavendulum]
MIDVGEQEFGVSGRHPIHWTNGCLRDVLANRFPSETQSAADSSRIGKLFNARNLSRIAGIEIRWTNNLANHLRLTDDDRTVFIFHHSSFLKLQRSLAQQLYPPGFIEETLRTLALLLPQNDAQTRRWIQAILVSTDLDKNIYKCGSLHAQERRFDQFPFWHDRLVDLKQVFDDSSPQTLLQWWWDRRNGVQWYTFWVAWFEVPRHDSGPFTSVDWHCESPAWMRFRSSYSIRGDILLVVASHAVATPANIGVEPTLSVLPIANLAPERINTVRSLFH